MNSTLLYILGVIFLLLGVGVSIALHELGHLWPAKAFKVPVSKYMVGFGPTIFSRKKGETEYGIKLIPLGGYISMAGMIPPGKDTEPKNAFQRWVADSRRNQHQADGSYDTSRAFYKLPIYRRVIIMLGGPFANLVLGVLFMMVALGGIGVLQLTTKVGMVPECIRDYKAAPEKCQSGDKPSPAFEAGLQEGDQFLAVNGARVTTWPQVQDFIDKSAGATLNLTMARDGKEFETTIKPIQLWRPQLDQKTGSYVLGSDGKQLFEQRYVVGIQVAYERGPLSLTDSASATWSTLAGTAQMVTQLPAKLIEVGQAAFGGGSRPLDAPVSIVGVGNIAGNIASDDDLSWESKLLSGLLMLGSLNFALFVFNLIPLLPLDGGHVLNALYEGAKRTAFKLFRKRDPGPFDTAKLMPFTAVMWFALLALGLFMITADIVKPVSL